MVRKRSNPDSESKMPVKDSSKEQTQVQRVNIDDYFDSTVDLFLDCYF